MDRIDLKKVLMSLKKASSKNASLDILQNMKMRADRDSTSFKTTNLETSITATTPETIEGNLNRCVDIYKLYKLLQKGTSLPDEWSFDYQEEGDQTLSVHNRFELPTLSSADFPEIPGDESTQDGFSVPSSRLLEISQKAPEFMQDDNGARNYLTGLFFDPEYDLCVASDAHTMVRFDLEFEMDDSYLVQRDTIEKLGYTLKKTKFEGEVDVEFTEDFVVFSFGPDGRGFSWEITGRLIGEDFPQHDRLIPEDFNGSYIFGAEELEAELDVIKQVGDEKTKRIVLKPDGTIKTEENNDVDTTYEHTLDCEKTGEVGKIAYNSDYLHKIVDNCEADEVELKFISADSPALIEDPGAQYLIMPLRLGG